MDLACQHCGTRAGHAASDELDTAECLDLVRQMAELGIKEITLIGGEAYLRPDWLAIVAAVRRHGMDCSMTTGGRGITRERAALAAEAGLTSVAVSLDGVESLARPAARAGRLVPCRSACARAPACSRHRGVREHAAQSLELAGPAGVARGC